MEDLKSRCNKICYDWFILVSEFGMLGHAIRMKNKDNINQKLSIVIAILLKIAHQKNICMNAAWNNWNKKAISKQYV